MKILHLTMVGLSSVVLACSTTVTVTDDREHDGSQGSAGSSSTDSGGGMGGGEAYCTNACNQIIANGGEFCGPLSQCVGECISPYAASAADGCLPEFFAQWDCITEVAPQDPWCQGICEDEGIVLQLCVKDAEESD